VAGEVDLLVDQCLRPLLQEVRDLTLGPGIVDGLPDAGDGGLALGGDGVGQEKFDGYTFRPRLARNKAGEYFASFSRRSAMRRPSGSGSGCGRGGCIVVAIVRSITWPR
jgi:hypothetical protein